jgi:type II secretory pathway component PulF
MPDYTYKATDPSGKIKSGVRFANNTTELRENLRLIGYSLISSSQGKGSAIIEGMKGIQLGGITRAQLIELCTNMAVMLKAGVPLITVLDELREDASTGYIQTVLGDILENISAGDSLYQAMAKRPKDFSPLIINLIQIGEETGQLNEIFLNIAQHYKRIDDLIRNVRKAMLYPAFVLLALLLAAFVFLTMVFPPLFSMLNEFEVELPLITKIVMGVSSSLKSYWVIYIGGIVLTIFLVTILRKYKPTRYWFDWLEVKTWFIKNLFLQLHIKFLFLSFNDFLNIHKILNLNLSGHFSKSTISGMPFFNLITKIILSLNMLKEIR